MADSIRPETAAPAVAGLGGHGGPAAAPVQRTLALLKPDVCGRPWIQDYLGKAPPAEGEEEPAEDQWTPAPDMRDSDAAVALIARIEKAGFKIVQRRRLILSKKDAEEFYSEHAGKPFFDKLTGFMSSGTTMALVLEKENAIADWRALMGPTNSLRAKEEAEAKHPLNEELWSLRAVFGTDGTRNATHGSDSRHAAEREIAFFFPEKEVFERSLAVVWPAVVQTPGAADQIVAALEAQDYFVLARAFTAISPAVAAALLGSDAREEDARAALQRGPAEVILVERVGAVPRLKRLVGPPPSVARASAPATLRARFGVDDAVLGIAAAPSAEAVRDVLLPALFPKPLPVQKTLCVIKPGTAQEHYRAILADIAAAGFSVLAEARRQLSVEEAGDFYAEHAGKPFFPGLCAYMSSGPVVALALAKPAAIKCWRQLMGPTNTAVARREKPSSLRAKYGVDGTRNATHGSDSTASAARELRWYFGDMHLEDRAAAGPGAVEYVQKTVVTMAYEPTRSAIVPKTVESVVVDALAALASAKPSSDPVEALRWLGQWMLDNNPRHGVVRAAAGGAGGGGDGPRVVEPEEEGEEAAAPRAGAGAGAGAGAAASAAAAGGPRAAAAPGVAASAAPAAGPSPATAGRSGQRPKQRTLAFILGGPGSGKGTQCARIAARYVYTHLSTGDLLRDEVASGSEFGRQLKATMEAGRLVDDATVLRLLRGALEAAEARGATKFLVDGYPRSVAQALEFERAVGQPTTVVAFTASEAVLEARLVERGKSSGRADDNVESIRKRFRTFVEQSAPVIDFYARLGRVRSVDSERSVDAVSAEVLPLFAPQLVWVTGGPYAGRRTQAEALAARNLGHVHLSVAELVQAEIESGSALGAELAAIRARGDRVPAEVTVQLLRAAVDGTNAVGTYLLSDCPRDAEQARLLQAEFGKPAAVVALQVPEEACLQRGVAARAGAGASSAGQREDGGVLPKRAQELRAVIRKQIGHYHAELGPVIAALGRQARVHRIDGSKRVPAVAQDVAAALQPDIVFVLGGPGAGKGTQCERISREFGYVHLSAGDLLRTEIARRSAHGELIQSCIREGRLVPEAITLELLRAAIAGARSRRFLVDGFPRDIPQARSFEALVGPPSAVLFFDVPADVMTARLLERGKSSGRADDNAASIAKRMATFHEQSMPVIRWYAERGAVATISSVPPPDAVYAAVRPHFASQVVAVVGPPGAGKGTQCARLAADFGFVHISSGALLRAELFARRGEVSAEADALRDAVRAGRPVPDDVLLPLVADAIAAAAPRRRFLFDGFPATMAQAAAVEAMAGVPAAVVHLELPAEAARARLQKRGKAAAAAAKAAAAAMGGAAKPAAGAGSPKATTPGAAADAADAEVRDDDDDAAIDARLAEYAEHSPAVLAHYKGMGSLKTVAAGQAPDFVHAALRALFQPQLVILAGTAGSGRRELGLRAGLELQYATLRVTQLLHAEMESGSALAPVIAGAMAMRRAVPLEAVLEVIHRAVRRSGAARFILDGFPRAVSLGFPSVHDQVFALEARIGPIRGCIGLVASEAVRVERAGAKTPGEVAAVREKVATFLREKQPVLNFFAGVGKAVTIDSGAKPPGDVYEAARPFLE